MAIIGINGKIGSGKDTIGRIIQYLTLSEPQNLLFGPAGNVSFEQYCSAVAGHHPMNSWQIVKFADELKEISAKFLGLKRSDLEKQEVKDRVLGDEWQVFEIIDANSELTFLTRPTEKSAKSFCDAEPGCTYSKTKRTVRWFMQQLGTEAIREKIHPNAWVNALFTDIDKELNIPKGTDKIDGRFKHGGKGTKIWRVYHNIKQRCFNQNHPRFHQYGERGITMCDEWNESFESFRNWAYNNGYNDSLTIDRKNNDKGYSPDNCRCVSYAIQNINTGIRKDNTSGFKGVSLDKGKWRAIINIKGKSHFLGYFDTAEEASEVYEEAFLERENLYDKEEEAKFKKGYLITDMRFQNEMQAVIDHKGITIRVKRPGTDVGSTHESETGLDKATFQYEIDNDGTIDELIEKVREILKSNNIV